MEWKKIVEFPNYSVSDTGVVRNDKFNRILAYSIQKKNFTSYARVTLFKENHRYYMSVHRLVAQAFLPNPMNLPQVDHKDDNGLNNHKGNLQWCTGSQNVKKSFVQNQEAKLAICSKGGTLGGATVRKKAEQRLRTLLQERFIRFHPSGELHAEAAVTYLCHCGVVRAALLTWKEMRTHNGQCPDCTGTVNRSNPSLR